MSIINRSGWAILHPSRASGKASKLFRSDSIHGASEDSHTGFTDVAPLYTPMLKFGLKVESEEESTDTAISLIWKHLKPSKDQSRSSLWENSVTTINASHSVIPNSLNSPMRTQPHKRKKWNEIQEFYSTLNQLQKDSQNPSTESATQGRFLDQLRSDLHVEKPTFVEERWFPDKIERTSQKSSTESIQRGGDPEISSPQNKSLEPSPVLDFSIPQGLKDSMAKKLKSVPGGKRSQFGVIGEKREIQASSQPQSQSQLQPPPGLRFNDTNLESCLEIASDELGKSHKNSIVVEVSHYMIRETKEINYLATVPIIDEVFTFAYGTFFSFSSSANIGEIIDVIDNKAGFSHSIIGATCQAICRSTYGIDRMIDFQQSQGFSVSEILFKTNCKELVEYLALEKKNRGSVMGGQLGGGPHELAYRKVAFVISGMEQSFRVKVHIALVRYEDVDSATALARAALTEPRGASRL